MARQVGELKLVGRVENFCCYKMGGNYFIRMRSSLSGKCFWKNKAFEGSRRSCQLMAKASPLASRLYKRLPQEKKGRPVYQALTGKVKLLIRQGFSEATIVAWFEAQYFPVQREAQKPGGCQLVPIRPLPITLPVSRVAVWPGRRRRRRGQRTQHVFAERAPEGDGTSEWN